MKLLSIPVLKFSSKVMTCNLISFGRKTVPILQVICLTRNCPFNCFIYSYHQYFHLYFNSYHSNGDNYCNVNNSNTQSFYFYQFTNTSTNKLVVMNDIIDNRLNIYSLLIIVVIYYYTLSTNELTYQFEEILYINLSTNKIYITLYR